MYCGEIPSKKVSWNVSDGDGKGKVAEFYCDKCFQRWTRYQKHKSELDKRLQNINFA